MWPAVPSVSEAAPDVGHRRTPATPERAAALAGPAEAVGRGRRGQPQAEGAAHGGGEVGELVVAHRHHVEQETAVVDVAEHRRRAAAQPPGELVDAPAPGARASGDARYLGDRQGAGAGARDRVDDLAGADRLAQPGGALEQRLARLAEQARVSAPARSPGAGRDRGAAARRAPPG